MTVLEQFEAGLLDVQYAEFIMKNADPEERTICNNDTLLDAMEDNYLLVDFLNFMTYNDIIDFMNREPA